MFFLRKNFFTCVMAIDGHGGHEDRCLGPQTGA